MAHGHGGQKTHVGHPRHHHVALCGAARCQKCRLGHELQGVAAKQRAVVVGFGREHDFRQLDGASGGCHASQFTHNGIPL